MKTVAIVALFTKSVNKLIEAAQTENTPLYECSTDDNGASSHPFCADRRDEMMHYHPLKYPAV
jgi:hypothetical protein